MEVVGFWVIESAHQHPSTHLQTQNQDREKRWAKKVVGQVELEHMSVNFKDVASGIYKQQALEVRRGQRLVLVEPDALQVG